MRCTNASLAARSMVEGKNCMVSASPLSSANGARSLSRHRRMSSRSVLISSNRSGMSFAPFGVVAPELPPGKDSHLYAAGQNSRSAPSSVPRIAS